MVIEKCDLCKKELPRGEYVRAGNQGMFAQYAFCKECGQPVLVFLRKHKLIKNKEKV
jgi:hydrogenase maturation factor HypF (carbamoyltransferase family)